MDLSQPSFSGQESSSNDTPIADERLKPTPDYGTLGASLDANGPDPISRQSTNPMRVGPFVAAAVGVLCALLAGSITRSPAKWARFADSFSSSRANPGSRQPASPGDSRPLDGMKPQKQAEALLEMAVGRSEGATDQIAARVDRWQGKVKWSSQIATLTTAALNSDDMRVRESGIEVELAAYGLGKNSASLEYLLKTAESPDHAQKIWALWALGLMGNRGVETNRVVRALAPHLTDVDVDSRRWTVEGLAVVGTTPTIELLLKTLHDDPSPLVRESAACGLAASGMFTPEQRLSAVPQLVDYAGDPSLDNQTRSLVFRALSEITGQRLPNDPAVWRSWYEGISSQESGARGR